jgi:thiol-disulfide isomerase/thioredoxin
MKIKPNNPIIIIIAIAIIAIVIIALQSTMVNTNSQQLNTPILTDSNSMTFSEKNKKYKSAPDVVGLAGYINTEEGFKLANHKGKVILVDFWTYSCINCIRTLPYLTAWDEKYRDNGLLIVGVHSPEFEFEKNYDNVLTAVRNNNIQYPVVQDNDFQTWRAYENRYWPHKFLIDADGFIRYDHIGEGGYEETEQKIIELLQERDSQLQLETSNSQNETPSFGEIGTPEIYLGYDFARAPLANPEGFQPEQEITYSIPEIIPQNLVALEGVWKNKSGHMELVSDSGKFILTFKAKNVNIVAGSNALLSIKVGESTQTIQTQEHTLYTIFSGTDYSQKTVEVSVEGKGFQLYTFTFG